MADLQRRKGRLKPVYARLFIPKEGAACADPSWRGSYLLRGFFALHPEEIDNVLSVRESLIVPWMGEGCIVPWFGQGLAAILAWDAERLARALRAAAAAKPPANGGDAPCFELIEPGAAHEAVSSLAIRATLPADLFPDAEAAILSALKAQHVAFTVERSADGYRIVVAGKSLKKRIVLGGGYRRTVEGLELELLAGRRLDVGGLFQAFPDPRAAARAVIEVDDLVF